jgi:SAM-dependent methyltransferase
VSDVTSADDPASTPLSTPAELIADADRAGGWMVLIGDIRQSYVDLDDPTYLDFEYMQTIAVLIAALPEGPLAITHVGGGACTLARYLAAVRPGSSQIVLEPDAAMTALIRARLPLPRGSRIRIRATDGRTGMAALRDASADVVILDAFADGHVPESLTTVEFMTDVARVLRPAGLFVANIADGPPVQYTRRVSATLLAAMPHALVAAPPGVLGARRFGNVVLAASPSPLPMAEIRRASAGGPFPMTVFSGRTLVGFLGGARPLTDAEPMTSPEPPPQVWRVQKAEDL